MRMTSLVQVVRARARPLLFAGIALAALSALPLLQAPSSSDWFRRPLSDDAFYYLVIARNVARGEGLTVQGQLINGFQPLHLLTCLAAGALARWHPTGTLAALTALNWLLYNVLGTLLVAHLMRAAQPRARVVTAAAVLLWLAHPYGQRLVLNGMETSLELVGWLVVGLVFLGWTRNPASRRAGVVMGVALGFAFWARNDAVLLALVFGAAVLLVAFRLPTPERARLLVPLWLAATVTLGVAAPWLLFNWSLTGSIIPQSGRAELMGGLYDLGRLHQVSETVASLVRNLSPLPLPLSRIALSARLAVGLPVLAALVAASLWALKRGDRALQALAGFLTMSLLALAVTYGTLFGAPHMLTRWFAPGIVVSVVLFGAWAEAMVASRSGARILLGTCVLVVAARAAVVRADSRMPQPTNSWQMVSYLSRHPEDLAVGHIGSFQSGLLAWVWSDRAVVNLDGKVNHEALAALRERRFPAWLAEGQVRLVLDQNVFGYERAPEIVAAFNVGWPEPGLVILRRTLRSPSP
jgi:hypothetical protein